MTRFLYAKMLNLTYFRDSLRNLNYGKLLYENFEYQLVKFCHINFVYLVMKIVIINNSKL